MLAGARSAPVGQRSAGYLCGLGAGFARSSSPLRNFMRARSHSIGAFDDQGFALFKGSQLGFDVVNLVAEMMESTALREKSVDGRIGLFAGVELPVCAATADLGRLTIPIRRIRFWGLVARTNAELGFNARECSPARDPLPSLKEARGSARSRGVLHVREVRFKSFLRAEEPCTWSV